MWDIFLHKLKSALECDFEETEKERIMGTLNGEEGEMKVEFLPMEKPDYL